jgi:uncharacterized protein DUF6950
MTIGDFLLSVLAQTGPWNCSTMPADWCLALGHPDFAARWRNITGQHECETIAGGNLLELWEQGIGSALPDAPPPYLAGDIAVIGRVGLQAGAIFTGERWAIQKEHGFTALPLPDCAILKAWRP